MSRFFFLCCLAVALFMGEALVFAQAEEGVQYKKETRYDFDDDVVEGELMRPDEMLVDVTKKAKHSTLIKIRTDFIPELLKSAEDI